MNYKITSILLLLTDWLLYGYGIPLIIIFISIIVFRSQTTSGESKDNEDFWVTLAFLSFMGLGFILYQLNPEVAKYQH